MKVRRVLAIGAVLVAAMCQALPASALFSGGASANCGYWGDQQCSGVAQDIPGVGAAGSDVEVNCNATTPYTVQAKSSRVEAVVYVQDAGGPSDSPASMGS